MSNDTPATRAVAALLGFLAPARLGFPAPCDAAALEAVRRKHAATLAAADRVVAAAKDALLSDWWAEQRAAVAAPLALWADGADAIRAFHALEADIASNAFSEDELQDKRIDLRDLTARLRNASFEGMKLIVMPDDPEFDNLVEKRVRKTWWQDEINRATDQETTDAELVLVSTSSSNSLSSSTRTSKVRKSYKELEDEELATATALSLSQSTTVAPTRSATKKRNAAEMTSNGSDHVIDLSDESPANPPPPKVAKSMAPKPQESKPQPSAVRQQTFYNNPAHEQWEMFGAQQAQREKLKFNRKPNELIAPQPYHHQSFNTSTFMPDIIANNTNNNTHTNIDHIFYPAEEPKPPPKPVKINRDFNRLGTTLSSMASSVKGYVMDYVTGGSPTRQGQQQQGQQVKLCPRCSKIMGDVCYTVTCHIGRVAGDAIKDVQRDEPSPSPSPVMKTKKQTKAQRVAVGTEGSIILVDDD